MNKILSFVKILSFLFFVIFFSAVSCFATITGTQNGNEYTYSSDNYSTDTIYTSTIFNGGYNTVWLNQVSATKLLIEGKDINQTLWDNNEEINLLVQGSSITVSNIKSENKKNLTAGYLIISDKSVFSNEAQLMFNAVYIQDNGSSFSTDIEKLHAKIINNGNFNITAGTTNNNEITGDGSLIIENDFQTNASIEQINIYVQKGTVRISSAINIRNTIHVSTGAVIEGTAGNFKANIINNSGLIKFSSGGTNSVYILGDGEVQIKEGAYVDNVDGKGIRQKSVIIENNAGLNIKADDLLANITNNGQLTFTEGTNNSEISGNGFLTVKENLINNKNIEQQSVTVVNGTFDNRAGSLIKANEITISSQASLLTGIQDLSVENNILNDGLLNINGAGTNEKNNITGTGKILISSDVENNAALIKQNGLENNAVFKNSKKIEVALLTNNADSEIENNGDIIVNNGLNEGSITGSGKMVVSNGHFVNNNLLQQTDLTIENGGSFITGAGNIAADVTNNALLMFTDGTNESSITGNGSLIIMGNVENKEQIKQTDLKITSGNSLTNNSSIAFQSIYVQDNAEFINAANGNFETDMLINSGNIENQSSAVIKYIFNPGTINGANGVLTISEFLKNEGTINQQTINVDGGNFNNVSGSSVVASDINLLNGSQFVTDFEDLTVESVNLNDEKTLLTITDENDAASNVLISGVGGIKKQGHGTLELLNSNTFSGRMVIAGGAIKISSPSNVGTSCIYMEGGKFIIDSNEDVDLENEFIATEHNNINMEVISSTVTLTKTLYGNENFIKTGSGTVVLQMLENKYAGNTLVSAGKIIGTTLNIKGILSGTGANNSDTFEFTDNDISVVLNEVDISSYIGTFNKTGSSTMTVTNNFKANNANITNGTFVINNIDTGKTFEVVNDIKFSNSYLKGNSNITAPNVIISSNSVVAPGNSTGTIKISGNLIFEDNSGYEAEIGQTDNLEIFNDKIEVSNSVNISSVQTSLNLVNIQGKYYQTATFEIINAGSNIENGFSTVTISGLDEQDLSFGSRLAYKVYNDANVMKVEITRKATDFSDSPYLNLSHNQKEAAKAMDAVSVGQTGNITEVLTKLEQYYYYSSTQDFNKLKAAFDDIAGVIYANSTLLTLFNAKAEHIYDKIEQRLTLNDILCNNFHNKIWAEYYYNHNNIKSNSNSPEFDDNTDGILAGFDMTSSKHYSIGITAGYGTAALKQNSDKTDMKDYNLGVYGGYENDKWQIKAMAVGGLQKYETNRKINFMDKTAESSYDGYNFALDGQVGYKIEISNTDLNHTTNLIPFAGLTGNYCSVSGFEEKGADDLNLKVNSYNNFAFIARVGAGLEGKVDKFGWYANIHLKQLLSQNYNEIETSLLNFPGITKMNIYSAEISKTSIGLNLGADYMLDDNWTIFANALLSFADKNNNLYFNVGAAYKFNCSNCTKISSNSDSEMQDKLKNMQAELDKKNEQLKEYEKQMQNSLNADDRAKALEDELAAKNRELEEAAQREKELKKTVQKYEAIIVSEQEAKKIRETKIREIRLDEKPTFVFAKAKLNDSGRKSLKEVAKELEKYPNSEILIEGHTDNIGKDKYNDDLSLRRAAAIAEVLKRDYKLKNRISIIGKGKREPISSNETKAGRAKNRRVEIIIGAPEKDN